MVTEHYRWVLGPRFPSPSARENPPVRTSERGIAQRIAHWIHGTI